MRIRLKSGVEFETDRKVKTRASLFYLASVIVLLASIAASASQFPDGFDWQYTVISALASPKHNPDGYQYLSLGLSVSMGLLLPYVSRLPRLNTGQSRSRAALLVGLTSGVLLGVESLLSPRWPNALDKIHELLALLCFVFIYVGVLSYSISRARANPNLWLPAILITLPLIAIGLCQLSLYLDQRDLGWVDRSWREMGIPLWQSFAFWQWIALFCLWSSVGLLQLLADRSTMSGLPKPRS